ncbi:hypothetical protein Cgig2_033422 [Carnegiea gigantea]|uniref:RING-type E3 ubiquitin transferase n=1 Tax=Carnegiea gigantea TaxID=171969 RepID=A0A9Q1KWK5_9CARY|nr:hypothetical protein Cgig2_033422 [Carnegiea gigantea]
MSISKGKQAMMQEGETEVEERLYIAVDKRVSESKKNVIWSLQNSGGKGVCILHVHQPAQKIPTPMGYFTADKVAQAEVKAYREKERRNMSEVLDEYVQLCQKAGVRIEKLYIESDSIEEGIIELVNQHRIRKLVMGAAAGRHYARNVTELKSRKAIYIRDKAPPSCHIWFVCKGYLIHTTAAAKPASPNDGENGGLNPTAPPFDTRNWSPSPPHLSADTNLSYSPSFSHSASARELAVPCSGHLSHPSPNNRSSFSGSPSSERSMNVYHDSADASYTEAKLGKIHSFQGTTIHPREDTAFMEAINQGSIPESIYLEECRRRKEAEGELARVKEQLEYMKDHVLRELRSASEQKSLLENQISNCNVLLKMLGEKLASTINLVHHYGEQ